MLASVLAGLKLLVWQIAIDAGMDSVFSGIISELSELVLEISFVSEEELIKIFAT